MDWKIRNFIKHICLCFYLMIVFSNIYFFQLVLSLPLGLPYLIVQRLYQFRIVSDFISCYAARWSMTHFHYSVSIQRDNFFSSTTLIELLLSVAAIHPLQHITHTLSVYSVWQQQRGFQREEHCFSPLYVHPHLD